MERNEILNQVKREIEPQVLEGYFDQILINRVVDATLKVINYSQCCKSDSEQLNSCQHDFINLHCEVGWSIIGKKCKKCGTTI